jgi:glutamate dehydrogenase
MASLLISEEEFLAIKPAFVEEVLQRLRTVARREAELIFAACRHRPETPHFELSILVSQEINRLGNALFARYALLEQEHPELIRATVLAYLPPVLVATAGERIWSRLPPSYRAQLVCTSIASSLIYREGLDYFRDLSERHLADLAIAYVLRDRRNHDLVRAVGGSGLADAAEIARLLEIGGTRAALASLAAPSMGQR